MKPILLMVLFFLTGCAVNVKESYRNPEFKQTLDKISVAWVPLEQYEYHTKYIAEGGYVVANEALANSTARKQLYDLRTRTRKLLYDELANYDTDIVEAPISNYLLQMSPDRHVKIVCSPTSCQSAVTVRFTLKDTKSDTLIWSSAVKVSSSRPPYKRTDQDGKEELVTPDTTQELAEVVIDQWKKYQLLPARLASPRTRPTLPNDPAPAETLEKRDPAYQKLLAWIKENNKWGEGAACVGEFEKNLESAVGGAEACWKIGWGLTKSGKAYRIDWTKKSLRIAELKPEDAALKGYREMKIIFTVQ